MAAVSFATKEKRTRGTYPGPEFQGCSITAYLLALCVHSLSYARLQLQGCSPHVLDGPGTGSEKKVTLGL